MPRLRRPRGSSNALYVFAIGSLLVVGLLGYLLIAPSRPSPVLQKELDGDSNASPNAVAESGVDTDELLVYCAAGMRYPLEQVSERYEAEYGVRINLQYGGSNTLLNQLEVNKTGDLFLAGDASYIRLAEEKGLTAEAFPLALMKPVIAVKAGNPKNIQSVSDLSREDVKVALGDPDAAAVGKATRELLSASGDWVTLEPRVTQSGVFKPTVNEVANAVKLGSVDAGVIWDSTVVQYNDLSAVEVAELDAGTANIEVSVVSFSKKPRSAIHFARYLSARDRGLDIFRANGFTVVEGDVWEEHPQLTFFAGAVNRAALEPIIKEFEDREGVTINAVFNGCGILTATMRGIVDGQAGSFPDVYMACDVYYLDTVNELFQDAVNVSDTDIVIVTRKDNPKGIESLADLAKPGVRVVLGQPDKCTIGVLSQRLLQGEGLYETIKENGNLVNQTTSSAFLIPQVATGAADAVLAYRTDTRAEGERLGVVDIDSQLAKAIQPFSVARSSDHKYLGRRLFAKLAQSRDKFESKGFNWRLDHSGSAGVN
ncbi:MAG: molybdate ABC transporter substrate-binding protein [Planctomycetaceae bacterium]|nr:molybdate ABC transporter substrate-binding protein [Planctomycetales bacterium]MCB9923591.1 molybdate ABC transporter substrate-binding protein [Planctomycetaceae bacterium]